MICLDRLQPRTQGFSFFLRKSKEENKFSFCVSKFPCIRRKGAQGLGLIVTGSETYVITFLSWVCLTLLLLSGMKKQSCFQGFSFSLGQQIERAETREHTLPQYFLSACFSSLLSTFLKGRKVLGMRLNKAARSKWVALRFGITLVNLIQIFLLLSPELN